MKNAKPTPIGSPHIDIRIAAEEKWRVLKCAKERQQTVSEFARLALLQNVVAHERGANSLENLLVRANEQLEEIRKLLKPEEGGRSRLDVLLGACIASSALLRDDGQQGVEVGRAAVARHIEVALRASDYVLQSFDPGRASRGDDER